MQRNAQAGAGFRAIRIQGHRPAVGRDRLLDFAHREPSLGIIVLICSDVGLQRHRPAGKTDAQILPSELATEDSQDAERFGVVGVAREHLAAQRRGFAQLSVPLVCYRRFHYRSIVMFTHRPAIMH